MKGLDEIKKILSANKKKIMQKYNVSEIGVFGSYVSGTPHKTSDVDILVEYREKPDLFGFVELRDYISDLLGIKVDLVMKSSLKPRIGRNILKEVVTI